MTNSKNTCEWSAPIQQLEKQLWANAEKPFAKWQEAYMRHQFPFIGVRAPIRKSLQALFLTTFSTQQIEPLWAMPEREFQYVVLDMNPTDPDLLEWLITHKPWWDTVDILATRCAGSFFSDNPSHISLTRNWINSDSLWLRRSAILFQLRYKEKTNLDLLFEYCLHCAHEKEFFIQKAIGWALREQSKTHSTEIKHFLHRYRQTLSKLTVREATRIKPLNFSSKKF